MVHERAIQWMDSLRSCPHLKWYEDGMHVLLRSREAPGQDTIVYM